MEKIILNKNNKFNTINISIRFLANIDRKNATYRALIPYVLRSACKNYPSDFLINQHLDDFYGANLTSGVMRSGNLSVIMFNIRFINPNVINDKDYTFKKVYDFLQEVIYDPLLENNAFKKEIVEREKENLRDEILSEIENKSSYALNKVFEIMFKDTNGAIKSNGYIEDLDSINEGNLYENYIDILSKDDKIIIVSGDFTDNDINFLDLKTNSNKKYSPFIEQRSKLDYEYKEEITDGAQSNLMIAYDLQIFRNDPRYLSVMIFNNIFGSGANSLLFQNVREKHSLCYSIYSIYNNIYGCMVVGMGIKHSDKEQCLKLVDEQIDRVINKDFNNDMLEEAKKNLINSFNSAQDSQTTLLTYAYNEEIFDIKYDLDEIFEHISKVGIDDIVNVARLLKKKAVFFLTGGDSLE